MLVFKQQEEIEVWKDIPGYEGIYQASSFGRIKSLARTTEHPYSGKITLKEEILKGRVRSGKYLSVMLRKDKKPIGTFEHQHEAREKRVFEENKIQLLK